MNKRIFIVLIVLLLSFMCTSAQIKVSGTVTDNEGTKIPGVLIIEKGTTNAASSNMEGKFNLDVQSTNAVLQFTFSGMNPVEEPIKDRTSLFVKMESINSQLFKVNGNRFYRITIQGNSPVTMDHIELDIAQFTKDYPTAEPPIERIKLKINQMKPSLEYGGRIFELVHRFYQRQGNDRVRITIVPQSQFTLTSLKLEEDENNYAPTQPLKDKLSPTVVAERAIRDATSTNAILRNIGGRTRLLYNGHKSEPFWGNGPWLYSLDDEIDHWKALSLSGIPTHVVVIPCESEWGTANAFWKGKNIYDYSVIKKRVYNFLRSNPEGKVILQILIDPYNNWGNENPSEICLDQNGRKGIGLMHILKWGGEPTFNTPDPPEGPKPSREQRYLPSLYSTKVREDIIEMIRHLVNYVEESELKRVIVGYTISGFCDAQFVNWSWRPIDGGMDDYSNCAQEAFRNWLRTKYKNDNTALQKAWKNPDVTFETTAIPSVDQRRKKDLWLDWKSMENIADFNRFYAEAPMDLPIAVSKEIKKLTNGEKVVISYFASAMNGWPTGCSLEYMLKQESIDILGAPADYWVRLPGYPGGCQSMPESVSLHQKLYMTEQDYRSYSRDTISDGWDFGVGRARNKEELASMIRRESGMMIAHGQGAWAPVHCMFPPETSDVLKETIGAFKRDLLNDEPLHADVAFFVGERSLDYLTNDKGLEFRWYLLRRQRDQWNMSGVPYHLYLQSDLLYKNLPEYKVYVFVSPQYLSKAERDKIEELKCKGHTLVFLHAPGVVGTEDAAQTVSKITGIKVNALSDSQKFLGEWIPNSGNLTMYLSGIFGDRPRRGNFGNAVIESFAFEVNDTNATSLAKYRDNRKIALAFRDFGTWRSIFCGIPHIDAGFLNNIAKEAGAWVVAPPYDAVYANQHIVTIHAISSGTKNLKLFNLSSVTDLTSGKIFSLSTDKITIEMKQGETRWFWLEPEKK